MQLSNSILKRYASPKTTAHSEYSSSYCPEKRLRTVSFLYSFLESLASFFFLMYFPKASNIPPPVKWLNTQNRASDSMVSLHLRRTLAESKPDGSVLFKHFSAPVYNTDHISTYTFPSSLDRMHFFFFSLCFYSFSSPFLALWVFSIASVRLGMTLCKLCCYTTFFVVPFKCFSMMHSHIISSDFTPTHVPSLTLPFCLF